jgi:hypothetical protein
MPGDHIVTSLDGLKYFQALEALGRKQFLSLDNRGNL